MIRVLRFQKALTYGSLSRMKIDNMREEHQEKLIKDAEKLAAQQKAEEEAKEKTGRTTQRSMDLSPYRIGEGIGEIFKGSGCWTI